MQYYTILYLFLLGGISMQGFAQTIDNRYELLVSQNGDGDFRTIQEAVNHVRDHAEQRVVIRIRAGIYQEKLVIPAYKRNISLKGDDRKTTIIRFDDYSGKPFRGIDVTGNSKFSTYSSYTVLVAANDCTLEDLSIENNAGKVGQAVALHTEGDRIIVRNCNILGNQDTFYLARAGARNYIENCWISGTTDYIFGAATAYFKQCTLESLSNSYITAASTTAQDKHGFVFDACKLQAKDAAIDRVFLGRPWRPYAKTVLINCELGKHIVPEGWNAWAGDKNFPNKERTVFYAEYGSRGEGAANPSARVSWSVQLQKNELQHYAMKSVFGDWDPSVRP